MSALALPDFQKSNCTNLVMIKAEAAYTEAEPESYEYLGDGKVLAAFKTSAGELVWYIIPTAAFISSIRVATDCMNANLADMLQDIGVF